MNPPVALAKMGWVREQQDCIIFAMEMPSESVEEFPESLVIFCQKPLTSQGNRGKLFNVIGKDLTKNSSGALWISDCATPDSLRLPEGCAGGFFVFLAETP